MAVIEGSFAVFQLGSRVRDLYPPWLKFLCTFQSLFVVLSNFMRVIVLSPAVVVEGCDWRDNFHIPGATTICRGCKY